MGNYHNYQDMAAEQDYRTTCVDEIWWEGTVSDKAYLQPVFAELAREANLTSYGWFEGQRDYEDEPFWVHIRFEVCPACEGTGKYVNPSIDAHGLTREDFDEDPDFEESYWRGDYDITCNLCRGSNVIPVPIDPAISKIIEEVMNERADYRAERLAELRAGC